MKLTVLGILAACGAVACDSGNNQPTNWYDPDATPAGPHERVATCDPAWHDATPPLIQQYAFCEAACVTVPKIETNGCKVAVNPYDLQSHACTFGFKFQGIVGCCVVGKAGSGIVQGSVNFYECP